jgi:hypothetical protein
MEMALAGVEFQQVAGPTNVARGNALQKLANDGRTTTYLTAHLKELSTVDARLSSILSKRNWGPLQPRVDAILADLSMEQLDLGRALKLGFRPGPTPRPGSTLGWSTALSRGPSVLHIELASDVLATNKDIEALLASVYMPLSSHLPQPAF